MGEAGADGGAEAAVAGVMEGAHVGEAGGEVVNEGGAAVGAAVVHEEDLVVGEDALRDAPGLWKETGEVLDLVVDWVDER